MADWSVRCSKDTSFTDVLLTSSSWAKPTRQVLRHLRGACQLASIHHSISCCDFPSRATCKPHAHRQKVFIPSSKWNMGLGITLCTDHVECNRGNTLPLLQVNDTLLKWERDIYSQIYSWSCNTEPQAHSWRCWAMAVLPLLVAGKPRSALARLAAQGSCRPGLAPWDTLYPSSGSAGLDPTHAHPGAPTAQKASATGLFRFLHKWLQCIRSSPVK